MVSVETAARAYVRARQRAADAAGGPGWLEASADVDASWHELVVAVTGRCPMCEPFTCPSEPTDHNQGVLDLTEEAS